MEFVAVIINLLVLLHCFLYCTGCFGTIMSLVRPRPFSSRQGRRILQRWASLSAEEEGVSPATSTAATTSTMARPPRIGGPTWFASRLGLDPAQNRFHAPLVYHEHYSFAHWPERHTFPMNKFARIAHALLTRHSSSAGASTTMSRLPRPLVRHVDDFFRPLEKDQIPRHWFSTTMTSSLPDDNDDESSFVERFCNAQLTDDECRIIGFREQTSRPELIERTLLEVAGTVLTCQLACTYGIAANTAGGTHHAHPTGGAGYTILNDLAIATHVMTSTATTSNDNTFKIQRVLVIDCDVHQGDGTAKFGGMGGPLHDKLFTLSLHCQSNYPSIKAQSTFDVGLSDGMQDDDYLEILERSVNHALAVVQPDLVIYDAGVDIYEHDRLGRLCISETGIRRRDRFVLERCVRAEIPVAAVVGGGYDKDVDALARRHAIVHEECAFVWRKYQMWKRTY